MKNKKQPKKFGNKVKMVGSLGEQLLNDKFAKPSKRIDKRTKKEEAAPKRKFVNMTSVLSQMQDLEYECGDKITEDVSSQLVGDSLSSAMPENVDLIVQEFLRTDMGDIDLSEEEKIFASLMPECKDTQKTFMEQVRETLVEKQTEIQTQIDEESVAGGPNIDPLTKDMCEKAGLMLQNYRSGPIPKMMKTMPTLRNWLQLLYHTNPEKWSAAAMFQLTRIYCSQKEDMVAVFLNKVLLPRVRDDIAHYKRLNYHLYQALGKSLFRPHSFVKGFLLQLCMAGDCTLREAIIIGSVMARKRIPLRVAGVLMLKIAEMKYTGANSIFLRILFNKKYALYWTVIDAVCAHFVNFKCDSRQLPVLWHQSLLTFVQRYKEDISADQKQQLYGLAAFHSHRTITPEIRRELESSKCRPSSL